MNGGAYCLMCVLFQYLYRHKHLPEFERFLAIEPVDQIVAPVFRSRDMLPKWFSMFDEIRSNVKVPPLLRHTHYRTSARVSESSMRNAAPKVPFDSKKVDNTRTVQSILTESANVARAATSSIIPTDRLQLLSSTITVTNSEDACFAVNDMPSNAVTLQSSLGSNVCHPVDVVPTTGVSHGNVLILTTDQLQQLGFNADDLPVVMTCDKSQPDTPLLHCDMSAVPGYVSVASPSSMSSYTISTSVNVNQLADATVTTSPNLIGRAFASAVGISIDQLSSFDDDDQWTLPPATGSQVASTAVSTQGICGITSNDVTVPVSEQPVSVSLPDTAHSVTSEDISSAMGSESRDIFGRCDVDVSALDITMLNSSLSPPPLSQPYDHHMNNDSTLATPKKMEFSYDDDVKLTFAGAKIHASDEAMMLPSATHSAVVTDGQYPVSCQFSEVSVSGESVCESLVPTTACTYAVGSGMVMSSVNSSGSVPSPTHGMALLSSSSHQVSDLSDIGPSVVINLSSSASLPASPLAMSLPSSSPHRIKQIPMHHMRSPLKRMPLNQRPILPCREQPITSVKSVSSLLTKPKPKKSAAKVHTKAVQAIAPKAIVAKSYLSPVKQVAAIITARAKRLQNSPSRNVWYTAPRLKTAESPSYSVRSDIRAALNTPDVWTLNDDDDEAASVEGEEQGTDADSQLEDELEEDLSAVSTAQSPSVYVLWLPLFCLLNCNTIYTLCLKKTPTFLFWE